jgi:hypothetical protein
MATRTMRVRIWAWPDSGYEIQGEEAEKEGWRSRIPESGETWEAEVTVEVPDYIEAQWESESDAD